MFAEEVKSDLLRHRRPLEVKERVRRLDLAPARPCVEHLLHDSMVVSSQQDVLVEILLVIQLLLIQTEKVVFCLDLSLGL